MVQGLDPLRAFLQWFDGLPPRQKGFISYLYLFCVTDDTGDWVLTPDEAAVRFRAFVVRPDVPIRKITMLVMICAFFDFIFSHGVPEEMFADGAFPWHIQTALREQGVYSIDAKIWRRTVKSWHDLRRGVLSNEVLCTYGRALKL
ncbi:MAG: hypothetical protein JRI45_06125 [Deltaproteobacteria bacterium]|nr:hypothetical protein [Deltaproteobacteria bacterium]MBW2069277.1 hypothetical protein [Deltaproteobacteria bacterium]